MGCGAPLRFGTPSAPVTKTRRLQSMRNILFPTLGPTHGLNSGSIDRRFGPGKLVISASPAGVLRSRALNLPRYAPAFGKKFSKHASAPCDLILVFFLITGQAHCGAASRCAQSFRL